MRKVLRKQSVPVFEYSDIARMKVYQLALVDMLVYGTRKDEEFLRHKIMFEIRAVEVWLKSITNDFILNNLREFKL